MAPKKKGKDKLAKMSDEDRLRYLQHQADIKEEARRRKEELISRYMTNKLHKEEAFSRTNLAKINQQWRYILRKLKVKDLQSDLQVLIGTFKRTMDNKNAVICKLMDSLEEAEEQYSYMLQSHMEMISQFLAIREDRLKFFQDSFEEQKFSMMESWEDELQNLEMKQKDAEYHMKLVVYQQEQNMKEHTEEFINVKGHFVNYRAITLEQEMNDMILPKQLLIERVWNELKHVFCDYVNYHSPKIQQYHLLRQKDATYRKDINHNMELLLAASDMIAFFQHDWETLSGELDQKTRNARDKRDCITMMSAKAKIQMMQNHIKDKEQLTTLSVESYEAIKKLERLLQKGQKVQQMEAMCKKYEMDGENVLQWNTSVLMKEDTKMTKGMMDDIETYEKLENFWFKHNRVSIHTETLRAERDSLRRENRRMKGYLKAFLVKAALEGSGTIKTEVIGRPSSMKMYRITPLSGNEAATVRRRPVTCIEASTCNAVQHERRLQQWRSRDQATAGIRVRRHCW